jgi:hypothetical protein
MDVDSFADLEAGLGQVAKEVDEHVAQSERK